MSEWIRVNDELPKEDGRYLCYWKTSYFNGMIICRFATNLEKIDKYDFDGCKRCGWYDYHSEYGYCEIEDVTHWMPLPEEPAT